MRHYLFLLCCLLISTASSAQVGVSGFYNFNRAKLVGDAVNPNEDNLSPYANGPELAVNYWFRLPKNRIEFQPTVYFAQSGDNSPWREAGFQFKTNIYVFDLGTDCDCPTFGKQGPQLEKGFFLQLSPGVARHWANLNGVNMGNTALTLGAGVGIDFGISNLLTLTPIASLRHTVTDYTGMEAVNASGEELDVRGQLTTFQLGLQATFRFDKKRY
ncbi:hypothetical protein [Lewinella sp. IMCC34191]|uniref:hypothetical protein n=1 Tax=Lewinella sp. IMCC34191 TaxID=2259172 RepID=UPI000E24D729|nr:hypothetical protein [Lewinella sp. IMCC34191]